MADTQRRIKVFIDDLDAAYHRRAREQHVKNLEQKLRSSRKNKSVTLGGKKTRCSADDSVVQRICEYARNGENYAKKDHKMVLDPVAVKDHDEWKDILGIAHKDLISYSLPTIDAVRTSDSITIVRTTLCKQTKIQLILRHYAKKSEILHGFDIGASAAGFDGRQVWLTKLGCFAYEYGHTIVDTARRSATYEARLRKYTRRGFHPILPRLNINAIQRRRSYVCYDYDQIVDLPYLPFSCSNIDEGNRVIFKQFINSSIKYDDLRKDIDGENIAYLNLQRLVNEDKKKNFIYFVQGGKGFLTAHGVLHKPPHLTLDTVHRLYDKLRSGIWDSVRLNLDILASYLPNVSVQRLMNDVDDGEDMDEVLDQVFNTQRIAATHLWKTHIYHTDHSDTLMVTENLNKHKSGDPFDPIMKDPERWYGKYFRPLKI